MRLISEDGYGVTLTTSGYQFPDAADEGKRRSWLMIEGTAHSPEGSWEFRWQALTPEDAADLSRWLRRMATDDPPLSAAEEQGNAASQTLSFVEPNLAFALIDRPGHHVVLEISLDLEFSPPWRKHRRAGSPFTIASRLPTGDLLQAAADWDAETAPYPP